ncbi:TPA: hypothetical protein N0H37_006046 [Pseudomonas aeruginosa]|uniref:hypothetical protein n=1 Tax=Pseudomonas aeruginosa TaxID=287 RepID=UPI0003AC5E7A|nr:hypothetical protein [Pseudomonas aeruginosa]EQL43633.1 hypothetical protein M770_31555 [Pseudomonas aeruginosa VRFPA03]RQH30590.1 hypothetical protein IPC106_29855 [Pseudomonas aeruginosa]HCE5820521.1 hypothetical protein [Pseudomonas aeruginosa]HCK4565827.1 hypothetical protein [Pseudomonas aeruginosa]HCK4774275.1 hypothetical protein [Pseudomonas aeruginosa]
MILRAIAVIAFILLASGLQFFVVKYGHWAESNIIVGISIAALICAFFAGGLSALDDQAARKRKKR